MKSNSDLFLHEEILLLALRDEQGTAACGTWPQQAMGGAILAELLVSQRIAIEGTGRKKFVTLLTSSPMRDAILDECIDKIKNAKRRAQVQTWVTRFSGIRRLHHKVAEGLCQRGVLREDIGKVLFIFSRKIYPELNSKPEREIIDRLRKAIFTEAREIDPRTVVLVSLANSAGLLPVVFDKKQLKERKMRIRKLSEGNLVGQATQQAIAAVQAAVMVAAVMPAIYASSTGH